MSIDWDYEKSRCWFLDSWDGETRRAGSPTASAGGPAIATSGTTTAAGTASDASAMRREEAIETIRQVTASLRDVVTVDRFSPAVNPARFCNDLACHLESATSKLSAENTPAEKERSVRDGWPRRAKLQEFTPAERAIYDALGVVEGVGADVRLTDAVVLLQAARESVADFVDGIDKRRHVVENAPESERFMKLLKRGDSIVSSDGCSWQEIAQARTCGHWFQIGSFGYIHRQADASEGATEPLCGPQEPHSARRDEPQAFTDVEVCLGCNQPTATRDCGCPAGTAIRRVSLQAPRQAIARRP